jgi:hypothetical protein
MSVAAKYRFRLTVGCLLGLLAWSGCSGELPVYPVRGRVLDRQGQPAAGAIVVLQPLSEEAKSTRAVGRANENGEFKLTTRNEGDGAPAGEFAVTVTWPTPKKTPLDPEGPDKLGGALATKDKSKIRFTVEERPDNEIPVINLP